MNEYYNIRYNIYKYFLNIENDDYDYYLSILIPILYLIIILLSLFVLILIQNITAYTIIYIIFLVLFYIIVYKLISSLKCIRTNETLMKYKNFYDFTNIIFKENLKYALNHNKKSGYINEDIKYLYSNKEKLLSNINNTDNIYGEDANKLLNTSYDLLKYFDLNEYIEKGFYKRLYISDFSFIDKNMPYIINDKKDKNNIIRYIDLEILEDFEVQQKQLLNYLNKKYNKLLLFSSKNIFTPNFNKNLHNLISNYKINIYYFIGISIYFIIILLHGLFVYFNYILTYVYVSLVILSLIILYYFN
jgi:hypothetical protein